MGNRTKRVRRKPVPVPFWVRLGISAKFGELPRAAAVRRLESVLAAGVLIGAFLVPAPDILVRVPLIALALVGCGIVAVRWYAIPWLDRRKAWRNVAERR